MTASPPSQPPASSTTAIPVTARCGPCSPRPLSRTRTRRAGAPGLRRRADPKRRPSRRDRPPRARSPSAAMAAGPRVRAATHRTTRLMSPRSGMAARLVSSCMESTPFRAGPRAVCAAPGPLCLCVATVHSGRLRWNPRSATGRRRNRTISRSVFGTASWLASLRLPDAAARPAPTASTTAAAHTRPRRPRASAATYATGHPTRQKPVAPMSSGVRKLGNRYVRQGMRIVELTAIDSCRAGAGCWRRWW